MLLTDEYYPSICQIDDDAFLLTGPNEVFELPCAKELATTEILVRAPYGRVRDLLAAGGIFLDLSIDVNRNWLVQSLDILRS